MNKNREKANLLQTEKRTELENDILNKIIDAEQKGDVALSRKLRKSLQKWTSKGRPLIFSGGKPDLSEVKNRVI